MGNFNVQVEERWVNLTIIGTKVNLDQQIEVNILNISM